MTDIPERDATAAKAVKKQPAKRAARERRSWTTTDERKVRARAYVTVAEFAALFNVARESVHKRIRACRLEPARVNGTKNAKYHIAALHEIVFLRDAGGDLDPAKLDPYRRDAFFKSELNRIALQQKAGKLIPVDDHVLGLARFAKILQRWCEVAPDRMEGAGVLAGAALERFEEFLNELRAELADEVAGSGDSK